MMVGQMLKEKDLVNLSVAVGHRVAGAPEFVQKVCEDCGDTFWTVPEQQPVCGYCQHNRNTKERIQAWYDKADYFEQPGRFLFLGGNKHSIKEIIVANDLENASEIAQKQFGLDNWYGCNIMELNEYRMDGDKYDWGPKTNFSMIAVKEYYEEQEAGL